MQFCSKPETDSEKCPENDLFPLKTGNLFFYDYLSNNRSSAPIPYGLIIKGQEEWRVESSVKHGKETDYRIRRNINRIKIIISGLTYPVSYDTVAITNDSVSYFDIHEDSGSSLSFSIYNASVILPRYYKGRDTLIGTGDGSYIISLHFAADSGMTYYSWGRIGNKIINESLILDSLHTIH